MDLFRFGGVLEVQYVLPDVDRQSQGEEKLGRVPENEISRDPFS
jgi:hypothetical protein